MSVNNGQPVNASASNTAWVGQEIWVPGETSTASGGSAVILTVSSTSFQTVTGSSAQAFNLPNAETLYSGAPGAATAGRMFHFQNGSTGTVTIYAFDGVTSIATVLASAGVWITNLTSATTNGTWNVDTGGSVSPLTTKGDIYTYTTVNARHGVPADYGYMVPDAQQSDNWRNAPYTAMEGRPGKNYIQYADFENNATTGWTGTGCATVTNGLPVSVGTGGNPFSSSNGGRALGANTIAPAIDSSSAIGGTYAMKLATTGAGTIGDGYISSAYTIDKADQAKVLAFKLYYHVASGSPVLSGTSANTYAVAIYDVANNAWLGTAGQFNFIQSTGVGICQGTFQTASTTTSIQIFVYSPVAPTGSSSLLFDDVYVGPQALAFGPAMTDWTSFTPTGGWTSNTTYTGWWKRDGDTLSLRYKVALSGAPTSATLTLNLPSGITIDTTKLAATPTNTIFPGQIFGTGAGHGFAGAASYSSTTALTANVYTDGSTASFQSFSGITQAVPYTFASADVIYIEATDIPIVGWSSNTSMSADTDTRIVSFSAYKSAGSVTASTEIPSWSVVNKDTHGAFNSTSGTYTIPVSGDYVFTGQINTTTGTPTLLVYVNGTLTVQGINSGTTSQLTTLLTGLTAGTTVWIASSATLTLVTDTTPYLTYFTLNRLSGPAVVAATESVYAFYTASGLSTSMTSNTPTTIKYTTLVKDTHGAYNTSTGTYTLPVSGTYLLCGMISMSSAAESLNTQPAALEVTKNGSTYGLICQGRSQASATFSGTSSGCTMVNGVAGDALVIQGLVSSTNTLDGSSGATCGNFFTISRVGN